MKKLLLIVLALSWNALLFSQDINVELVNQIIDDLVGEQKNPDIPTYKKMKHVCRSAYVSCDKKGNIVGLDFQFTNLNGHIPQSISQLRDLEYINLEYNYLSGPIPPGLSELTELSQLSLKGNFITGPLPDDLVEVAKGTDVDLSQNVIAIDDSKVKRRLNIIDQVNLEGCRSPDSIFLSKRKTSMDHASEEIEVDTDGIEGTEIEEDQESEGDTLFGKIVETMPRFPGCEDQGLSDADLDKCAQEKMLQFVYENLRYPSYDRNLGIEGMVVVQFVVLRDGSLGDVNLVRSSGGRMGNSGQWIVNRMNYICDKWIPGVQRGKKVKVLYTFPIKFELL